VTGLIDDMQAGRLSNPDGSLDCDALNDRIKALHGEVRDEESRVELLRLHNALMSSSDKRLVEQGRDPAPLREEWRRTHLSFLLAESLTDGEVDAAKLARVNAREVAAGRLHPDETIQIRKSDPQPAGSGAAPGLIGKAARGLSRLFGGGRAAAPPAGQQPPGEEPASEEPAAGGDGGAELERAYRAILLWEEEKMRPRLDALVDNFRIRLGSLEPGQDPRAAAENEILEIGRWFEENENGFVAEAVSCLDDDLLGRLKSLGVDGQFGAVIFNAIDEARAELARRLGEAREAAFGQAGGGG
jgi:hypothetical protein